MKWCINDSAFKSHLCPNMVNVTISKLELWLFLKLCGHTIIMAAAPINIVLIELIPPGFIVLLNIVITKLQFCVYLRSESRKSNNDDVITTLQVSLNSIATSKISSCSNSVNLVNASIVCLMQNCYPLNFVNTAFVRIELISFYKVHTMLSKFIMHIPY